MFNSDGLETPLVDSGNQTDAEQEVLEALAADEIAASLDLDELAVLVSRVVRQDEAALASLYDSLCSRVYAVALQVTGQISTAEEAMQDTFWQIWRQAPRYDPSRGNVIAWVLTMARSRALDARRASTRNVLTALYIVADEHVEYGKDRGADPLDLLQTVRRDSELHTVLAELDPIKRQLISLVFYRGMTHDEVAAHTGLPLGTVKSHLRRAFSVLRTTLGADFHHQISGVPT